MHFFQIPPLVDNEHVGQIQSLGLGQDGACDYVLCLSVTKLFLVLLL